MGGLTVAVEVFPRHPSVGPSVGRRADGDLRSQGRDLHLVDQRAVVDATGGTRHEHDRIRERRREPQFVGAELNGKRRHDRAHPRSSEDRHDQLHDVRELDHDHVVVLDTVPPEPRGHPVDLAGELAVGETSRGTRGELLTVGGVRDGEAIGRALHEPVEEGVEGVTLPPPSSAVRLELLGRCQVHGPTLPTGRTS